MTSRASGAVEWDMGADDRDDEGALGPEDYAWLAHVESGPSERLPRLAWIWDRGEREVAEHLMAVAVRGPLGSA